MCHTAERHASIQTTGNVYMQEIPASVRTALNSRTRAILATRPEAEKTDDATGSSSKKRLLQVLKNNGSSGRTRTYNPPVNSRMIEPGAHVHSVTSLETSNDFGARAAHNVSQNVSQN